MNEKTLLTEQANIFKALGHPSRLLMVEALGSGEKCVCELRNLVGDDLSTVSRHLSVLKGAGIVEHEKPGTNIYYRLKLPCLLDFLSCTQNIVRNQLEEKLSLLK